MKVKAFTLIEAIIVGILLLVIVTVVFNGTNQVSALANGADDSMRSYVTTLVPESSDIRVQCARLDTDGNGYVRCTASYFPDGLGNREIMEAECHPLLGSCVPIKAITNPSRY